MLLTGFDLVAFAIDCVMSGTVVLPCGYTIHCSFIAKCQYFGASLPSVNTIHWSFIANCQYNTLQLYCQMSTQSIGASLLSVNQYIAASLPGVNTIALEMFCGAKYIHYTFTPFIKHHSIRKTANIGVKRH